MAKRRKSIRLFDHERSALVKLYLAKRITVSQYAGLRASELQQLCDEWRGLTGCTHANGDVLHYMRNERKCGRWVTLDGEHLRKPKTPVFSPEDVETLREVYDDLLVAFGDGSSENIAYDDDMKTFIAKEFAFRADRVVPIDDLVAKLTDLRKRGQLTRVADVPKPAETSDEIGFIDISEVS